MAITKKELAAVVASQKAELDALKAERAQLITETAAPAATDGIRVVKSGLGKSPEELFLGAAEDYSFVTYGAVAQALGLGERFLPSMMKDVISFIESSDVDYLVVNAAGKYGAGAPVAQHRARLQELGYTQFPEQGSRRKKGKKAKGLAADPATIAAIVAATMAALQ